MPQKDSTTDSHRAADLDYSADDAGSANGIFGWKAATSKLSIGTQPGQGLVGNPNQWRAPNGIDERLRHLVI